MSHWRNVGRVNKGKQLSSERPKGLDVADSGVGAVSCAASVVRGHRRRALVAVFGLPAECRHRLGSPRRALRAPFRIEISAQRR